jgi:nitrogenase molybdenum-iron protein NifN
MAALPRELPTHVSTTNACHQCMSLGACIAFRGVEGAVSLLHGSQGCSTYMRRYLISHFNEPVDIASSSFAEEDTVYGGAQSFATALENQIAKYSPALIGVATTCLSETIGDNVPLFIGEFHRSHPEHAALPITHVGTPSYAGTHADGYYRAVTALVDQLTRDEPPAETDGHVAVFAGLVSPADLRVLRGILAGFGLDYTLLPDFSDTLDGPAAAEYRPVPEGGTPLADIRRAGRARAAVELLGRTHRGAGTPGAVLRERFGVARYALGLPIGVRETDVLIEVLSDLAGRPMPAELAKQRGRLVDAYVDGHKYLFGKRAVVFGEEDLVIGLAAFLEEIGVMPVLCASGGRSGRFEEALGQAAPRYAEGRGVLSGADFREIEGAAEGLRPDLIIGNSKGYKLSRALGVPLIRVGFPIHDRLGGQRIKHVGYEGAQELFDRIVNTLIGAKQDASPVGYTYM